MMYEDLIKALRYCANDSCEHCAYLKQGENCFVKFCGILQDAADAIEELQKQRDEWESHATLAESFARGWIPVTERLPKENGRYLVRHVRDIDLADGVHSDEVRIMRFVDSQWRFPFICTSYVRKLVTMEKVTHWMPLPEPPKEEI